MSGNFFKCLLVSQTLLIQLTLTLGKSLVKQQQDGQDINNKVSRHNKANYCFKLNSSLVLLFTTKLFLAPNSSSYYYYSVSPKPFFLEHPLSNNRFVTLGGITLSLYYHEVTLRSKTQWRSSLLMDLIIVTWTLCPSMSKHFRQIKIFPYTAIPWQLFRLMSCNFITGRATVE